MEDKHYKYFTVDPDPIITRQAYWTEDGVITSYPATYYDLISNTLVPHPEITETTEAAYNAQQGAPPPPPTPSSATGSYGFFRDSSPVLNLPTNLVNLLTFTTPADVQGVTASAEGFEIDNDGFYTVNGEATFAYGSPASARTYVYKNDEIIAMGDYAFSYSTVENRATVAAQIALDLVAGDLIRLGVYLGTGGTAYGLTSRALSVEIPQ